MTRPMISIVNVETQEEITREMNDAEYAQYLIDTKANEERSLIMAEEEIQAAALKAAKEETLAALGLSQDIINLLAK